MAHSLEPNRGSPYLNPEDVVSSLRRAFDYVEADAEAGRAYAARVLAKLIELNAPQVIIDHERARQPSAVAVVVGDDPESDLRLSFLVKPDDRIFISYADGAEERRLVPLTRRCARALNYRVSVI